MWCFQANYNITIASFATDQKKLCFTFSQNEFSFSIETTKKFHIRFGLDWWRAVIKVCFFLNSMLKVLVSVSCSWLEIMKQRVPLSSQKLFRFLPQKKKSLQQLICALTATPTLGQRGNLWNFSAVWYCFCDQKKSSFENMKTCRQIWNGKNCILYILLSTATQQPE